MSQSPEVLEEKFNNLKEKMLEDRKLNANEHQEIKQLLADGINSLSKQMEEISKIKANKWVETFLIWVGGVIGVSLLTLLGSLVYKAIIVFN